VAERYQYYVAYVVRLDAVMGGLTHHRVRQLDRGEAHPAGYRSWYGVEGTPVVEEDAGGAF